MGAGNSKELIPQLDQRYLRSSQRDAIVADAQYGLDDRYVQQTEAPRRTLWCTPDGSTCGTPRAQQVQLNATKLTMSGDVNIAGTLSMNNLADFKGDVNAKSLTATGDIKGANLVSSGNVSAATLNATGDVRSAGNVFAKDVTASGNVVASNLYNRTEVDAKIAASLQNAVNEKTLNDLKSTDLTLKNVTSTGNVSVQRSTATSPGGMIRLGDSGDPVHSLAHASVYGILDQDGPFLAGWHEPPAGHFAGSLGSITNNGGKPGIVRHALRWEGGGRVHFPHGIKIGAWTLREDGGDLVLVKDGAQDVINQGFFRITGDGNIHMRRHDVGWVGEKLRDALYNNQNVWVRSDDNWNLSKAGGAANFSQNASDWEKMRLIKR